MTAEVHAIWVSLLADPNHPSSAVRRRLAEQRRVLDVVRELQPGLLLGERGLIVSSKQRTDLLNRLQIGATLHGYRHRKAYLIRVLEEGQRRLEWTVAIPTRAGILRRPPSPFTPRSMAGVGKLEKLERVFLDRLPCLPASEDEVVGVATGELLFSAVLYGGLLDRRWWQPWLIALPAAWHINGGLCLEMERETTDGTVRRRWIADPTSEALLRHRQPLLDRLPPDLDATRCLDRYLETLPSSVRPPSQATLTAWATSRCAFHVPSFLVAYARGRGPSVDLPREAFVRVQTGFRVIREPPPFARSAAMTPIAAMETATSTDVAGQEVFIDQLRAALRPSTGSSHRSPREALAAIDDLLKLEHQFTPTMHLVVLWVRDLLTGHVRGRPISARSALRYAGTLAAVLVALSGADDIRELEYGEILDLYTDVITTRAASNERANWAGYLELFHEFIVSTKAAVARLEPGDLIAGRTAHVDANLVSPQDFERILEAMGPWQQGSRTTRVCRLLLILGYRCGLRRSEALYLRVRAIAGWNIAMEVEVRNTKLFHAKSADSVRRLPAHALLEADEIEEMRAWVRLRRTELGWPEKELGEQSDALLFADPGAPHRPAPGALLFEWIHHVMRTVTGDGHLRFHALRHSFASLTLLHLLDLGLEEVAWPVFPPLAPFWNSERARRLRHAIFVRERHGLPALYAVSRLCGHADPGVTLQSYVHLCEVFLACALSHPEAQPDLNRTCFLTLTGFSQASAYRLKERLAMSGWNLGAAKAEGHLGKVSPWGLTSVAVSTEPPLEGYRAQPPRLTEQAVHWTLVFEVIGQVTAGVSPQTVGDNYGIPVEAVRSWCGAAKWLRSLTTRSGGTRLRASVDPSRGGFFDALHSPDQRRQRQRLDAVARKMQKLDLGDNTLGKAVRLFIERYDPVRGHLILRKPTDIVTYDGLLANLELAETDIQRIETRHGAVTYRPLGGSQWWRCAMAYMAVVLDLTGKVDEG